LIYPIEFCFGLVLAMILKNHFTYHVEQKCKWVLTLCLNCKFLNRQAVEQTVQNDLIYLPFTPALLLREPDHLL
jgi:hypothetical protein